MLVTLEGYSELDGLGKFKIKRKKLKRLVKKAKKVAKKVSKSPITKIAITAAAASIGVPPSVTGAVLQSALSVANGSSSIQDAITKTALSQAGVSLPKGISTKSLKSVVANLPASKLSKYSSALTAAKNSTVKKIATTISKKAAEVADGTVDLKSIIKATNKVVSAVASVDAKTKSSALTESAGDAYYKEGKLMGDTTQELKVLATKIYSQNPYTKVSLVSWEYVQKILNAYIYAVSKLSNEKGKSYYYSGTSEAERKLFFGNLYTKIVYLYFKGYETEAQAKTAGYDYTTRDQIWVTLSLLMKFAQEDSTGTFNKFWKPYEYKDAISTIDTTTESKNKMFVYAGIGALGLLLLSGQKGRMKW